MRATSRPRASCGSASTATKESRSVSSVRRHQESRHTSATYQMKQLRCDSIGWVRVSPSKGSGSLIVGFDVAHELAAQVGNGFEDSAGNNVALDFGEPVFDLVEPGTISGGGMQRDVWMVGKEAIHELGFVGGEVVYDEVDSLSEGCVATTSWAKRTNSWLVWRLAVLAMTWPLLVSRAA